MPEQAIIRSADSSKPTKARVDDTVHPKVTVEFDYGETQYAVVRLLIPPQDEVGLFDSDARLDLRYVSASALSGNVQFGVKYALIDISEGQDKALSSEVASTTSAYTGSANTHYGVSFTLTGVFSGLDTTKRYTLVLQITRKQPASDLAANVSWISGVLMLNQQSASVVGTTTISSTAPISGADILNKTVVGDTSGGAVDITLPSLLAGQNNYTFSVIREGGSLLRLLTPSTSYYIKYPAYVDDQVLEFPSDGDSATLIYKHATQTYYVIG